ncbi:MAG: MGMT family protein [Clostridia bacterium]|nr:MGMT family protein [Clostridia bacterium]
MNFFESVYEAVKRIPKGKVATYGQIALLAGSPKAARQVGWALHKNPYQGIVPCHRVVFRNGKLTSGFAFGGIEVQKSLLESEGVIFKDGFTVDLDKCLWRL